MKDADVRDMAVDKQHPRGATLMEIMAVIAVIGILLVIAALNMGQFSSAYRLRGATREVATDLQYARLLAVKENKDFQVVFSSNSYQVVRLIDMNVVKSRSFFADYPNVTLTNVSITFGSRGTFDPSQNGGASSVTVFVSNPAGTKNVLVSYTGRVKIQ